MGNCDSCCLICFMTVLQGHLRSSASHSASCITKQQGAIYFSTVLALFFDISRLLRFCSGPHEAINHASCITVPHHIISEFQQKYLEKSISFEKITESSGFWITSFWLSRKAVFYYILFSSPHFQNCFLFFLLDRLSHSCSMEVKKEKMKSEPC